MLSLDVETDLKTKIVHRPNPAGVVVGRTQDESSRRIKVHRHNSGIASN